MKKSNSLLPKLINIRQWDSILKFRDKKTIFLSPLQFGKVSMVFPNGPSVMFNGPKALFLFKKLLGVKKPSFKLFNQRRPNLSKAQITRILYGTELYHFYSIFQEYLLKPAKSRHTSFSVSFSSNLITFRFGNLGELPLFVGTKYDYFLWEPELEVSFYVRSYQGLCFFSGIGLFKKL